MFAEEQGEHAVKVEVVPLDQRADRRGSYDPRQAEAAFSDTCGSRGNGGRHHPLPDVYSRVLSTRKQRFVSSVADHVQSPRGSRLVRSPAAADPNASWGPMIVPDDRARTTTRPHRLESGEFR